jgi:hypothetical protein
MACLEIAPGIWHWTARHPRIGIDVSSYYLAAERVAIDPLQPPEEERLFERLGPPEHVLLTNRHHDRDAWKLRARYGCLVHCVRQGAHELQGRGPVQTFEFGQELPGGIRALEVDAICPDETALHIPTHSALAVADGVVRMDQDGPLGFVPDELMDEPEQTKAALRAAYLDILDSGIDLEVLLLAHGSPVTSGAGAALRAFAAA